MIFTIFEEVVKECLQKKLAFKCGLTIDSFPALSQTSKAFSTKLIEKKSNDNRQLFKNNFRLYSVALH